jgi:hypothetical protein
MDNQSGALAEAMIDTVFKLVPALENAGPLTKFVVRSLFPDGEGAHRVIERTMRRHAQRIADDFLAAERAGHINPGSGHASVTDLVGILERTTMTPAFLIELGLDVDRLWAHMQEVGAANFKEASVGRAGRVRGALREVAEAILEAAVELPAVRLGYMREVLRRLPPREPG